MLFFSVVKYYVKKIIPPACRLFSPWFDNSDWTNFTSFYTPKSFFGHVKCSLDNPAEHFLLEVRNKIELFFKLFFLLKCSSRHVGCSFYIPAKKTFSQSFFLKTLLNIYDFWFWFCWMLKFTFIELLLCSSLSSEIPPTAFYFRRTLRKQNINVSFCVWILTGRKYQKRLLLNTDLGFQTHDISKPPALLFALRVEPKDLGKAINWKIIVSVPCSGVLTLQRLYKELSFRHNTIFIFKSPKNYCLDFFIYA